MSQTQHYSPGNSPGGRQSGTLTPCRPSPRSLSVAEPGLHKDGCRGHTQAVLTSCLAPQRSWGKVSGTTAGPAGIRQTGQGRGRSQNILSGPKPPWGRRGAELVHAGPRAPSWPRDTWQKEATRERGCRQRLTQLRGGVGKAPHRLGRRSKTALAIRAEVKLCHL